MDQLETGVKCPSCGFEESFGAQECRKCSVNFAKWEAKKERLAAMSAAPAETPVELSSPADNLGTVIKLAVKAGVIALLFFGGRSFVGWFGGWFKTAQDKAPAARMAAMQNMSMPKINLPQTGVNTNLTREIAAMQQAQSQAMINAAVSNAQRNAAISAAVKPYSQPPLPSKH